MTTFDLPIQGMTCASCAGRVERALRKLPQVSSVSVNLASEQARIEAPAGSLPQLISAIEGAGYSVPSQPLELDIEGMTCASCVGRIERALSKLPGISQVTVNLADEKARLQVLAGFDPQQALKAVAAAGYKASLLDGRPATDEAGNRLRRERLTLLAAIILTLPLVVPMLAEPFGQHWMLPAWAQFLLATPVQFIFGARFTVPPGKR